jgi:glutathione synthase/RimK-type ligase-like ATP-grasp enzyme
MLVITQAVAEACRQLNIPFQFLDKNQNFIAVQLAKPYYFINFTSPFGRHDIAKICRDKDFCHQLLQDTIRMPDTKGWLDPFCRQEYQHYAAQGSYEAIATEIEDQFALPVIVKRNQGSRGSNVFRCESRQHILTALQQIYNQDTKSYDFVALAQEYIPFVSEYRVIVFFEEILLVYKKDIGGAHFTGNLSPLHWENAKAIPMTKAPFIEKIRKFIQPIFSKLELELAGLDILEDTHGNLWLLEINSQPDFGIFARDNGLEPVVEIYKKMILRLKNQENSEARP